MFRATAGEVDVPCEAAQVGVVAEGVVRVLPTGDGLGDRCAHTRNVLVMSTFGKVYAVWRGAPPTQYTVRPHVPGSVQGESSAMCNAPTG